MSKAAETAYGAIREGITNGDFAAGTRLREEDLSSRVGVSRTPIREALRRLAAEGIVEFLPNRGAHVASWSDIELEEIFELRSLLESHAAARAAARIERQDLERLQKLADEMEQRLDERTTEASFMISKLNNEFHSVILEANGSRHLESATQGVIQVALVHRTFVRYSPHALRRSFAHHRELIDALTARDPDWAKSVMRSHILAARNIFSESGDQDAEDDEQAS